MVSFLSLIAFFIHAVRSRSITHFWFVEIRHGIKQRRTSWQDGVLGTNCPIPPHSNWTYKFQLKDQIGTYMYYPSTSMHRAIGGFGAVNVNQRSVISIPYPAFAGDFTLLVGDWYKANDKVCHFFLNHLICNGSNQLLNFVRHCCNQIHFHTGLEEKAEFRLGSSFA